MFDNILENHLLHMTPGGTERWSEQSRYDQRDRRTARIYHDGKADLFGYDPAGQVIAAAYGQAAGALTENGKPKTEDLPWHQTFQYDPAGNRTRFTNSLITKESPSGLEPESLESAVSVSYTTNEANQYVEISEKGQEKRENGTEPTALAPRYDENGNLLNDERNTYTWDADIHLLSVSTQSGSAVSAEAGQRPAPHSATHFRYDALHRRVARLEVKQGAGADGKRNTGN